MQNVLAPAHDEIWPQVRERLVWIGQGTRRLRREGGREAPFEETGRLSQILMNLLKNINQPIFRRAHVYATYNWSWPTDHGCDIVLRKPTA